MSSRISPERLFDSRQVRRAFGRAAAGYDAASPVQREIESRLLESLDHWALRHRDEVPQVVVDVACGPARAAHALRARWPRSQVIAHADMAPTRKRDPGARFPWATLHAAGFGRWPTGVLEAPPPGFDPWLAMAAIGYPLKDRAAAVRAFHRHFRGRDDGEDADAAFDAEDLRILHALSKP